MGVGDGKARAAGATGVASGSSPVVQQADPLAAKTTRTQTTVLYTIGAQFPAKQNADCAARVPLYTVQDITGAFDIRLHGPLCSYLYPHWFLSVAARKVRTYATMRATSLSNIRSLISLRRKRSGLAN